MVKRLVIVLFTSLLLFYGCGDDEEDDSGEVAETSDSAVSKALFSYNYTDANVTEPFHAYDRTQFRIIHNGICNYSFSFKKISTGEITEIAQGYGGLNALKVYPLVADNYLLDVSTGEGCDWKVEIESIGGVSSNGDWSNGGNSGNDTDTSDEDSEFGQGCCSSHGGADRCEDGRVVCKDGTLSPTCTCP